MSFEYKSIRKGIQEEAGGWARTHLEKGSASPFNAASSLEKGGFRRPFLGSERPEPLGIR